MPCRRMKAGAPCVCCRKVKLSFTRYSTSERIAKKNLLSFSAESENFQKSDYVNKITFLLFFFNLNYCQGKKEIWEKLLLKLRQDKLLAVFSQSFHLIYLILEAELSGSGWPITGRERLIRTRLIRSST